MFMRERERERDRQGFDCVSNNNISIKFGLFDNSAPETHLIIRVSSVTTCTTNTKLIFLSYKLRMVTVEIW